MIAGEMVCAVLMVQDPIEYLMTRAKSISHLLWRMKIFTSSNMLLKYQQKTRPTISRPTKRRFPVKEDCQNIFKSYKIVK